MDTTAWRSTDDYSNSVSTSKDGSVYIAGSTVGELDGQPNIGYPYSDAFLSKYNSDGSKAWTKLVGSSSDELGYGVSTSEDGAIYIVGSADANLDGQFNNGQTMIFLSKFSSDGPSNKPPISISISTNSFNENISAGSLIATMQGTDPDINETFTYALVGGEGSIDNNSFTVDDDKLKIKESPNHEIKDSYSIRLRTTDSDGLTFEKAFTLTVRDVNEAPTNIYTTTTEIDRYIPNSSVVATLSSADQDVGDTHTYDLVTGSGDEDNSSFVIDGDELKIKSIQDQETKDSYSIRLRTTDSGGLNFEKSFALTV